MDSEDVLAPGWPGIAARWTSSAKSGVGSAVNVASKVSFTISHGIINEIYYPQVDKACTRDMEMIVTNGKDFFSEEKRHTINELEYIATGVPAYRLTNTCDRGNYKIEKEILVDPMRDTLLQQIIFSPLKNKLEDYKLYVLLAPHLGNHGSGNTAWIGDYKGIPMLFAERKNIALALACSIPWEKSSVGFVGTSDGWQDLKQHKQLTWKYLRAENGNVTLAAEIDLLKMKDSGFTIAIGFGLNPEEAGQRARASLFEGYDIAKKRYIDEWKGWQKKLYSLNNIAKNKTSTSNLYRISTSILRIHESKRHPGGFIASLSIPWGFSKGDDDLGGYHLVWPRDMVQTAGGLLAAKAGNDARRVLNYLVTTQEADGHWSQNMWLNGVPYREGIQMDQTASPILLIDLANREGILEKEDLHQLWPMVRSAAEYLMCNGPSTQQERWEENSGYTPYTLAVEVAALLIAADIADLNDHPEIGNYLRETADAWNASIEKWTYVTNTDLAKQVGVEGYYVRISHNEIADDPSSEDELITIINRLPGENLIKRKEMISPDALALVRFGLRDPEDPRILNTIKVIDAFLKLDTPVGPCWYRYNKDGYGEHEDGSPYDGTGIGRPWPLLVGERAHYEIAAGRFEEAKKLSKTFEKFANEGGMIPEQIWDKEDKPEKELFFGKASGAAMPLVWAHSEYIKLCRSLKEKEVFDMPPQTKQRYLVKKKESNYCLWNFNNQCRTIPPGKKVRIETLAPAIIRWSTDNWETISETPTKNIGMKIHFADLPTKNLSEGTQVVFTFFWKDADKWENNDFSIEVEKEKHLIPA